MKNKHFLFLILGALILLVVVVNLKQISKDIQNFSNNEQTRLFETKLSEEGQTEVKKIESNLPAQIVEKKHEEKIIQNNKSNGCVTNNKVLPTKDHFMNAIGITEGNDYLKPAKHVTKWNPEDSEEEADVIGDLETEIQKKITTNQNSLKFNDCIKIAKGEAHE